MAYLEFHLSRMTPLSITLAGHKDAEIGKPVLMMALDMPVRAIFADMYSSDIVQSITKAAEKILETEATSPIQIETPFPDVFMSVKASIIVAITELLLHDKLAEKPHPAHVQQQAYEIEKAIFKNMSHGQTVAAIQGGFIYFRKEFQFFRTVFQIPGKFDDKTQGSLFIYEAKSVKKDNAEKFHKDVEKNIKRLVFAIRSENTAMVHDTLFGDDKDAEYILDSAQGKHLVLTRDSSKTPLNVFIQTEL